MSVARLQPRPRPAADQQRRAIWSRVGQLQKAAGMSREQAEDVLRVMLHQVSGQGSTKALTAAQAADVMELLDDRIAAAGGTPVGEVRAKPVSEARRRAALPRDVRKELHIDNDGRFQRRDDRSGVESDAWLTTLPQSEALLELADLLGWGRPALAAWVKGHMAKVVEGPWPQKRVAASALHEGLAAQVWRLPASQPAQVLARAQAALALPGLTEWERGFLGHLVEWKGRVRPRWKPLVKLAEIERERG